MAIVLGEQGKHQAALDNHHEALLVFEATLGCNHPQVAATLVNIANVYQGQGLYDKALETYEKSLKIDIMFHGMDHPVVATTKSKYAICCYMPTFFGSTVLLSIAVLYKNQAKYTEALSMHREVLDVRLKALGPDHPLVATTNLK